MNRPKPTQKALFQFMDLKYILLSLRPTRRTREKQPNGKETKLMLCVRWLRIGSFCECVWKKNRSFPNVYCRHVIIFTQKKSLAYSFFRSPSLSVFVSFDHALCVTIVQLWKRKPKFPFTNNMNGIAYACRSQIVNRCGSRRAQRETSNINRQQKNENSYTHKNTKVNLHRLSINFGLFDCMGSLFIYLKYPLHAHTDTRTNNNNKHTHSSILDTLFALEKTKTEIKTLNRNGLKIEIAQHMRLGVHCFPSMTAKQSQSHFCRWKLNLHYGSGSNTHSNGEPFMTSTFSTSTFLFCRQHCMPKQIKRNEM